MHGDASKDEKIKEDIVCTLSSASEMSSNLFLKGSGVSPSSVGGVSQLADVNPKKTVFVRCFSR